MDMSVEKLNIQEKADNPNKKALLARLGVPQDESLSAQETNKLVGKTNELVEKTNELSQKVNEFNPIESPNYKETVATYADLLLLTDVQKDDMYQVEADGRSYVYNGTSFQPNGKGFQFGIKPPNDSKVAAGNELAVSGGEVYEKAMITSNIMDIVVTEGVNLFNKEYIIEGQNIDPANGIMSSNSNRNCIGYIKVTANEYYVVSGWFGSASQKVISVYEKIGDKIPLEFFAGVSIIQPTVSGYISLPCTTITSDFRPTLQIEKGNVPTPYTPYVPPIETKIIKEEFLPVQPALINNIDVYDERYSQNLKNNDLYNDELFKKSLRKVKPENGFSKTITITNKYGKTVNNIVVPIYLSNENSQDNTNARLFYLNGNSNNDLSNIRFKLGNELLRYNVVSDGNYFFKSIQNDFLDVKLVNGTYYCSPDVRLTTDLVNFSTILDGFEFAYVDSQENIYASLKTGVKNLVKFYKSTNYTTSKIVIDTFYDTTVWRLKNFAEDYFGNIYIGAYQEDFDVSVYKSTDMGETFLKILSSEIVNAQHVHNIIIDKGVTPNVIYVSCDGNASNPIQQLYSIDYGSTWIRQDLNQFTGGQGVDNGIFYANNNVLIGGSEGAGKRSCSIFASDNGAENIKPYLWGQNVHLGVKLNDTYFVMGQNYLGCCESNIFMTNDFKTWNKVYQDVDYNLNNFGTGNGYRYGSYGVIKDTNNEDCVILTTKNSRRPNLMVYTGSEYYSQLVYLYINELPLEGLDVTIESGYLTADIPYNRELELKDVFNLPLNERLGKIDRYNTIDNPIWSLDFATKGVNIKGYKNNKLKKEALLRADSFNINENLDVSSNKIAVSFWYKFENYNEYTTPNVLFKIGNLTFKSTIYKDNIAVTNELTNQTVTLNAVLRSDSKFKTALCIINIDKDNNFINGFMNDGFKNQITLNMDTSVFNSVKIGNETTLFANDVYFSDFKIYDHLITQEEASLLYNTEIMG